MDAKTYDLVNLSEETLMDIVESLVKDGKDNTAFYMLSVAKNEDWYTTYKTIVAIQKQIKGE